MTLSRRQPRRERPASLLRLLCSCSCDDGDGVGTRIEKKKRRREAGGREGKGWCEREDRVPRDERVIPFQANFILFSLQFNTHLLLSREISGFSLLTASQALLSRLP